MGFLGQVSSLRRKWCLPAEPTNRKRPCNLSPGPAWEISIQIFFLKDLTPQKTIKSPPAYPNIKGGPSQGLGLKELMGYFGSFQMVL